MAEKITEGEEMPKLPRITLITATLAVILFASAVAAGFLPQADAANPQMPQNVNWLQTPPYQPLLTPLPCYGPHITSKVNSTQVNIGDAVTVTGQVCPAQENFSVRITFTRPDYTWIDQWVLTDSQTGEFNATQKLDMIGFWNIFPIYGHISDRLYTRVIDPANPDAPQPTPEHPLPAFKTNWNVIGLGVAGTILGVVALATGIPKRTRNVSSLRLFLQILFVFLLFFGVFIDHQNLPIPSEQIAPHEFIVGGSLTPLPDGLPVPTLACWFPCGRTVTCPLWQLQVYIYPFWTGGHGFGVDYMWTGAVMLAVVIGLVLLASIVLGRWWCGWVCPFGLYMDLITRLRKALKIEHRLLPPHINEKFHQLAYIVLAALIVLSVLFASEAIAGTQLVPGTQVGGFTYTYFTAPFCQVCPMKPLCMLTQTSLGLLRPEWTLGTTTGQFWQLGQYITSLNLLIFGIVTIAGFYFRRSWCRICPLGGLIALFNRYPPFKWVSGVKIHKTEEKCTKCGVCKRVCPTQVTEVYERKGGDVTVPNCILCLRCVEMCPEKDCLKFKVCGKNVFKSRNWVENP